MFSTSFKRFCPNGSKFITKVLVTLQKKMKWKKIGTYVAHYTNVWIFEN